MDQDRNGLPLGFLMNTVGRLIFEATHQRMDGMPVDVIELGILWLVDLYPGRQQSDYARFQRRDVTTFGRYVDKLEAKGFLSREPVKGDRRAHALHITKTGSIVLEEGRVQAVAAQEEVIGPCNVRVTNTRDLLMDVLVSRAQGISPCEHGAVRTCSFE